MKTYLIQTILAGLYFGIIVRAWAGSIQSDPPYDSSNNNTITVATKADGTADVTFTVKSSDPTFNVSGTFTNASSFNGSFSGGATKVKTVTYPSTAAGLQSSVTITVTTSDAGGTCTASTSGGQQSISTVENSYVPYFSKVAFKPLPGQIIYWSERPNINLSGKTKTAAIVTKFKVVIVRRTGIACKDNSKLWAVN